ANKLFKFKTLVYFTFLLAGTIIGYFIVKDLGVVSVIVSLVGCWIMAQIIMNIFYARRLGLKIGYFAIEASKGLLVVSILTFASAYVINLIDFQQTWVGFIFKASIICVIYILLLYKIGMNK